jgi:hypothetical protein
MKGTVESQEMPLFAGMEAMLGEFVLNETLLSRDIRLD